MTGEGTEQEDAGCGRLIAQLEGSGDFRVLRRLVVPEGATGLPGDLATASVGVVVDCETTGLDPAVDAVIELAMRRLRYDADGRILEIGRAFSWREDPGRPLDPVIVKLTGLTDADLAGQAIDTVAATAILRSAKVVIAHNAGFDRKVVERRLPDAAGLAWACSCNEIDWPAAGFDTRRLGWLLAQAGFFHGAHRADADVDAVLKLLRVMMPNGRTALRELLDTAGAPTAVVEATGAHFDVKDALKARGYRWDGTAAVWRRDVPKVALTEEEFWLAANVYRPDLHPRSAAPSVTEMTWFRRHA